MSGSPGRKARRQVAREAARKDGKQRAFTLPKWPVMRPSSRNALVGRK